MSSEYNVYVYGMSTPFNGIYALSLEDAFELPHVPALQTRLHQRTCVTLRMNGDIGFRIFRQPVSHREEQHVLIRGGTAMEIVFHLKYVALGRRGSSTVAEVSQCTGARPITFKL
jgi:hypothetical protein